MGNILHSQKMLNQNFVYLKSKGITQIPIELDDSFYELSHKLIYYNNIERELPEYFCHPSRVKFDFS